MLYNYPSIMKNNIFFISTDLSVLFTPDKVKHRTLITNIKHGDKRNSDVTLGILISSGVSEWKF